MSHTIYAGSVSKRKNSTLQPSLSTSFDVLLKTPTSLHTPTFTISAASFPYNYLKWDDRYYFVTDVVAKNNSLFEVSAVVDVLATFKSSVLATTAYVLYDSVANTELPDNRLPMKTTKTVQASTAACPFTPDSGCYILSLTGSHNTSGVYKCTGSELAALIDDVSDISDNIWDETGITPPSPPAQPADVVDAIVKFGEFQMDVFKYILQICQKAVSQFFGSGNIPENIRECRYIPFNVGTTQGGNKIYLGTFETKQTLGKLNTETVHRTTSVSIPWQATDFRRRAPYTDIYLYLPYIGMIRLSSENLAGQSSITVAYTLALRDGSMICTVSSGSEILGQFSGNVGASVPVGISNINLPKAAQSVISGVANAAAKNIGGVGLAAINFGDSITPNFTCIGGLDGIAGIAANQNITCYTVFHDTIVAPNSQLATIGAPSMCPKSLGSLTGYVQCADAHVSAPAELQELEELDNYLNSGFYIE